MRRLIFILFIAAAPVFRPAAQEAQGLQISGFRVPDYDEAGRMKSQLFGELAQFSDDGDVVDVTTLRIELYKEDGSIDAVVVSPFCRYFHKAKKAQSDERIRMTRAKMQVSGKGYDWDGDKSRFVIHSSSKVVLRDISERLPEEFKK